MRIGILWGWQACTNDGTICSVAASRKKSRGNPEEKPETAARDGNALGMPLSLFGPNGTKLAPGSSRQSGKDTDLFFAENMPTKKQNGTQQETKRHIAKLP